MTSQAKSKGFATLGLDAQLVTALVALGYEEPTPIQRESIPVVIDGGDLLAQAATGTGKTAAFALPMLHRFISQAPSAPRTTRGLVLVPTRELAMQVSEAIHKYGRSSRLAIVPVYGGASMYQQVRALERGAAIVVATPGRALDHLKRGSLDLSHVEMLVLDEADEMLDMGFAEDLDALLEATPATRQTALFSATMPARILSISQKHLNKPTRITISIEKTSAGKLPRVRQVAYPVARPHKAMALQRVLDTENPASALVFCRTRLEVDTLVERLNAHGYRAEALHGGMQQRQRDAVMGRFRQAKVDLLIATDVAARGLDIEQLSHVFNYDLPSAPEAYVHRIGRTGRAGRGGTAITLVEPREHRLLRTIEQLTKQKIEVCPLPTVADLRAKRLELTRATLRERLEAADFGDVRGLVESLAEEFDIFDVAAAAVKLAQLADSPRNEDALVDLPEPAPIRSRPSQDRPRLDRPNRERPSRDHAARHDDGPFTSKAGKGHPRRSRGAGETVRLFIGAGKQSGIRPADLVGAITNEAGVTSSSVGAIDIRERFSLVDVPAEEAARIVKAMRGAALRGQKVPVRVDRDQDSGADRR